MSIIQVLQAGGTGLRVRAGKAEIAWKALRLFESSKADFADCLVERMAAAAGCTAVMTFNNAAVKAGMTLLV